MCWVASVLLHWCICLFVSVLTWVLCVHRLEPGTSTQATCQLGIDLVPVRITTLNVLLLMMAHETVQIGRSTAVCCLLSSVYATYTAWLADRWYSLRLSMSVHLVDLWQRAHVYCPLPAWKLAYCMCVYCTTTASSHKLLHTYFIAFRNTSNRCSVFNQQCGC